MATTSIDIVGRLLLSALLSGLIGWERERADRPAGLRTHILVSVGSTLVMITSVDVWEMYRGLTDADPTRIAAQVVSGIGFLGAGTILREGTTVRGLTTAASLWVVAGVGLAVGAGLYAAGVATVAIVLASLLALARVERRFLAHRLSEHLTLVIEDRPGQLGRIGQRLGELDVSIRDVAMRDAGDAETVEVSLHLRIPSKLPPSFVVAQLAELPGVRAVRQPDPH